MVYIVSVSSCTAFQSTLPTRGSDENGGVSKAERAYFNPRSPRGGATSVDTSFITNMSISIHAPHEGERHLVVYTLASPDAFQSTLPTRGSDHVCAELFLRRGRFQSTLPTRGSDLTGDFEVMIWEIFQSTLPTRGSDLGNTYFGTTPEISIHAPHEGERLQNGRARNDSCNISIHAPHEGERPTASTRPQRRSRFQSTLPTRGSDGCHFVLYGVRAYFNPRSPRGGATIGATSGDDT